MKLQCSLETLRFAVDTAQVPELQDSEPAPAARHWEL